MKELTQSQEQVLKALTKMYDENQKHGYIKGGVIGISKEFNIPYYNFTVKSLVNLKLIDVMYDGEKDKYVWSNNVRPTYLTAIKSLENSVRIGRSKAKRYNKKETTKLIEHKPKENESKVNHFVQMYDNIILENKNLNNNIDEIKLNLIKAEKNNTKLNTEISDYKDKQLESYTTSLLWGLIKIKTKLNYGV